MKWKNYGLWVSLASILYMVFRDLGVQIDLTTWETYVTAVLGILATLGVISNPDKGKGFFDKLPTTPTKAVSQITQQIQNQTDPQQQTNSPQYDNQMNQQFTNQTQNDNQMNQQFSNQSQNDNQMNQQFSNQSQNDNQMNQQFINQFQDDPTQSQMAEPSEVDSAKNPNVDAETSTRANQNQTVHRPFERDSIHGMPPPPNEHI